MPVFRLTKSLHFPPAHLAEDGLVAVGGDLSSKRLLAAYRSGIFPWYSAGDPILWWSPDPRMVLFPEQVHISRSLQRTLRDKSVTVTGDTAFAEVIAACASQYRADQDGTWILPEMVQAYRQLHELGFAHSIECRIDGELAGGLYGVSIGGCFFGESMFSHASNTSKIALVALCRQCVRWDISMIDCQMATPHLCRMGARETPRFQFLKLLSKSLRRRTIRGPWQIDDNLLV